MIRKLPFCMFCVAAMGFASQSAAQMSFLRLDDLPGGNFYSQATGVANNGFVVGASSSVNGGEAFRWTPSGGGGTMSGLGDLPGGAFDSRALLAD